MRFPVAVDGSPRDARALLRQIGAAVHGRSRFRYRLDETGGADTFVPVEIRDGQGRMVSVTPLLDRRVTIPHGRRPIHASAALMAAELSRETGLRVSCCQSAMTGIPWGMAEMEFGAESEPARSVLRRLGLTHWHLRCDRTFCVIDLR